MANAGDSIVVPLAVGFGSYAMLAHGMPVVSALMLVSYLGFRPLEEHAKADYSSSKQAKKATVAPKSGMPLKMSIVATTPREVDSRSQT